MSGPHTIRPFRTRDYPAVLRLWRRTVGTSGGDDRATILRLAKKNPGTCLVASADGKLVGTIMGTHDFRRGYIFHLAIDTRFRRRGIASALVRACMTGMRADKVRRVWIFVRRKNRVSWAFWKRAGWRVVDDVSFLSREV